MKLHSTYLCEPNALVREGIKGFLSGSQFKINGEYADMAQMQSMEAPELIIVGVERSHGQYAYHEVQDGIAHLRAQYPDARLVLLLAGEEANARDALCWTADSCVLRETSQKALLNYLSLTMMGEKVLPASIVTPMRDETRERDVPVCERGLSDRERDIIRCLINGDSNKTIALRLAIAEATVKAHLKAILRKLGARNRTQAALWGVSQGLEPVI